MNNFNLLHTAYLAPKDEECPHDDLEGTTCADCGEDRFEDLVCQAEAYAEGDR